MLILLGQITLYLAITLQFGIFLLKILRNDLFNSKYNFVKIAQVISLGLMFTTFVILILAFTNHMYELETVYLNSDNNMSIIDLIIATWAGRQGVLLLWATLASIFTTVVLFHLGNEREDPMISRSFVILLFMTWFIYIFNVSSGSTPFEKLDLNLYGFDGIPENGQGLTPSLRSFWQQIHPPLAFLAYSIFIFPYAFGIAGIIGIKQDEKILRKANKLARNYLIIGFMASSILLIAGSIWAYEAAWNGFWAWDPIEVVSLVMWLAVALYFHTYSITQANHPLRIFSLTFPWVGVTFASFVVRSGLWGGFHDYVPSASSIIFGLIFGISLIAALLPTRGLNTELFPELLFNINKDNPKLMHVLTFWTIVGGMTVNTMGLLMQLVNTRFFANEEIPYVYYIFFNGIIFFGLVLLLFLCDANTVLSNKKLAYGSLGAGFLFFFIFMFMRLSSRLGQIFILIIVSVIGAILIAQFTSTIYSLVTRRNLTKFRMQMVHLIIIMLILPYFVVDYGQTRREETFVDGETKIITEFDITVTVQREDVSIRLFITDQHSKDYTILLEQGVYAKNTPNEVYYNKGAWISQPTRDLYFKLTHMTLDLIVSEDTPIDIEIYEKPYANLFRISFYAFVLVGVSLTISILVPKPSKEGENKYLTPGENGIVSK